MSTEDLKQEIAALDQSDLEVSDWEAAFIATVLEWEGSLTPRQKESGIKILSKYAGRY